MGPFLGNKDPSSFFGHERHSYSASEYNCQGNVDSISRLEVWNCDNFAKYLPAEALKLIEVYSLIKRDEFQDKLY